jgi:hypothetical protein
MITIVKSAGSVLHGNWIVSCGYRKAVIYDDTKIAGIYV